jgi:hypothetical protein
MERPDGRRPHERISGHLAPRSFRHAARWRSVTQLIRPFWGSRLRRSFGGFAHGWDEVVAQVEPVSLDTLGAGRFGAA